MSRLWGALLLVVMLLSGFLLFTTPGFAEDSEIARQTLKGLAGFNVIVEDLQPNLLKYEKYAKEFDLNKARIQRDIEARLSAAGIPVLPSEKWQKTPGRPVLYVNVNTHENEKYWFAYDIKLEIRQVVSLEANPAVKMLATTWSINITGIANIGKLNVIPDEVGVLTQRFIQAYRAMNK